MANGQTIKDMLEGYKAKDADTQRVLDCIRVLGNEVSEIKNKMRAIDKQVVWLTIKTFMILTAGSCVLTGITWLVTLWSRK